MIHANTDSIRPETRLAALALYRPDLAASQIDQDGADQSGPSKGDSTSTKGLIPELESAPEATSKDTTASTPVTIADSVMGNDITSRSDTSSTVAEIDTDNDHRMDLVEPDQAENNPAISKPELPSRPPPVPPRHQNLKQIEFYALQQDAAEVLNNVFDLLSCAVRGEGTMEDGEQDDLIKRLFFFEVTTVFKSDTQTQTQSKTELQDHYLISTNNRDRPLYSALDDGFSLDTIEGGSLLKFEYIKRAAPIQIINVKRAMWLSGKTVKDKSKIGLEDVIYLDRYLQETKSLSQEALQELRQQQWQLRKNLKSLERRKKDLLETEMKMDLSTAVEETASLIELIDKDNGDKLIEVDENPLPSFPGLADQLRHRKKELEREAEALDSNMMELDQKINNIFKERQDHPYHLHAVFMHRGDAGGGHYWIYIYDFQNKVWRNYNDERVEEAQMQQVFYPEGNATSTSVVYVRADQILELTEAVNRNPDPLPVSDNEVEMQDLNNDEFAGLEVIDGIPPS
jgi:ubiquitin carboxyl-terminal hydrolase 25/28